jgi:hypothetical protein
MRKAVSEMDEYLKRKDLIIACKNTYHDITEKDNKYDVAIKMGTIFKKLVYESPPADVVPRSEVERIFEEIEKKVKASLTIHLEEINKEHIKDTPLYDRHSGIIFAMQGMDDFIVEFKKKYTEEKK